jgi:dTDP-4-dehydrorhamnose reductase
MKILGTGLNGLVGTRIVELLKDKYEFENISRNDGIDITNQDQIIAAVTASDAPIVLHLAAKTNVDGCELDKEFRENGEAWKINVLGTQNIIQACKKTGKKLIYFSTDFVFDGVRGDYVEEDTPHPINWYAMTKYKGEEAVKNANIPFVIARLAYPYGKLNEKKKDFIQAILAQLRQGNPVASITDHFFVPTLIDDVASALDRLILSNADGIYHLVGSQALSPYEASLMVARVFNCDESLVKRTTREEYFKKRALRPYDLSLKNDKIQQLGVLMKSFEDGLQIIKKQDNY